MGLDGCVEYVSVSFLNLTVDGLLVGALEGDKLGDELGLVDGGLVDGVLFGDCKCSGGMQVIVR